MTCDEVRDAFSDFYDGRLFGARLTEVTQHLDECSDCRAEWATFSMTLQAVSRLGTAHPSPDSPRGSANRSKPRPGGNDSSTDCSFRYT